MKIKDRRRLSLILVFGAACTAIFGGCGVHDTSDKGNNGINVESGTSVSEEHTEKKTEKITEKPTKKKNEKPTEKITENHVETPTEKEAERPSENTTYTEEQEGTEKLINFSGCAFVGDSRIKSIETQKLTEGADFFSSVGIAICDVKNKAVFEREDGSKCTLLEALYDKHYEKIYLMLGINDLGWPEEQFCMYYEEIVKDITQHCEGTEINIIAILPMVESRTDEVYNNKVINKFNKFIKATTEKYGCKYIDASPAVELKDGTLPEDASNDGIHLKNMYNIKLLEFLKEA